MVAMSQSSPPGSLLRLREADIVRVCGLASAAAGLEIAGRQAVRNTKRSQGRLEGRTMGKGSEELVWVEVTGQDPITIHWNCSCQEVNQGEDSLSIPPLACPHVAALLTNWIRDPASFDTGSSDSGVTAKAAPRASSILQEDGLPARAGTQPPERAHATFRRESTLADEIGRMSTSELLAVTRRVLGGEDVDTVTTADARRRLETALSSQESLATLMGRLQHEAQTLLAELLLVGGSSTARDLDAMAERGNTAPGALRSALGVLERHALIFPAGDIASWTQPRPGSSHPWRQVSGWRVPSEVRSSWKPALPIPAAPVLTPHGPPTLGAGDNSDHREPSTARTTRVARANLRQLYLALSLLAHAPARFHPLLQEGRATATDANPLSRARRRPNAERFPFPLPLVPGDFSIEAAIDFARGAGIPVGLAQMARRIVVLGREHGTARMLLDLPFLPAEDQRHLLKNAWRTWCGTELPLELADLALPGSRVRCNFDWRHDALRPAAVAAEVGSARGFLLYLVRLMEPGVWYSLSDLLDLIWRINPFFLRGRQNAFTTPAWWLEATARHRPLRAGVREDWMQAEAEYIRAWLAGPLHWWGVVDLATTAAGRPIAIRLTGIGAHLLDRNRPDNDLPGLTVSAEEWGPALVVTQEGRLAVSPLAAGTLLQDVLATWARPVGIAGGRVIYTFDAGSAAEAFDHGVAPEHLLALLRQDTTTAGKRALAAAEAQFAAWKAAYGGSSITTGWTLLEARDEATLHEVLLHVHLLQGSDDDIRRLSPAAALVTPRLLSFLEADLRKRGFAALS